MGNKRAYRPKKLGGNLKAHRSKKKKLSHNRNIEDDVADTYRSDDNVIRTVNVYSDYGFDMEVVSKCGDCDQEKDAGNNIGDVEYLYSECEEELYVQDNLKDVGAEGETCEVDNITEDELDSESFKDLSIGAFQKVDDIIENVNDIIEEADANSVAEYITNLCIEVLQDDNDVEDAESIYSCPSLFDCESISDCESVSDDCEYDDDADTISFEIVNETQCPNTINEQPVEQEIKIHGRRLVDVQFFVEQVKLLNNHSSHYMCNFSNMILLRETKMGLRSTYLWKCTVCHTFKTIYSEVANENSLNINYSATLSAYATGIGFSQSEEFFGNLEVPYMTSHTFDHHQRQLQRDLEILAEKEAKKAMDEEKRMAILNGLIDGRGVPLLTVYADGCWAKRSYGTNYSALSGFACLIGFQTRKVVDYGVKNKYCKQCNDGITTDHDCTKNFEGSPTAMEQQIILEAFQRSEKDHGVRYCRLISDGDSKTYKSIIDARVYQNPYLHPEKRECCLHLYRSSRGRLLKVKNLSSGKTEEIIKGIKCSRKYWAEQDIPTEEKELNLRRDILNAPFHVFGQHTKCASYFCKPENHKDDVNYVTQMKPGQMNKIYDATTRLLDNAGSLLYNQNTNICEQFNSIVVKHNGAKRVNYTKKRSFKGRIDASVIDFNTGGRLGSEVLKHKLPNCDYKSKLIYQVETKRIKTNRGKTYKPKGPKQEVQKFTPDEYYGPNCDKDLDSATVEFKKSLILDELKSRQEIREQVEKKTTFQHGCSLWRQYHKQMITSSIFGRICKARSKDSHPGIVREILYTSDTSITQEIRHGIDNESDAIKVVEDMYNIKIKKCGLFIDQKLCFLGATPYGLIDDDGIVEIKYPYKAKDSKIEDAVLDGNIKFWQIPNALKRKLKISKAKNKVSHSEEMSDEESFDDERDDTKMEPKQKSVATSQTSFKDTKKRKQPRQKQAMSVAKKKKVNTNATKKIKKAAKYTKKQKNGEAESNDEFCEKSGTEDGEEAEPEQNTNTKRKGVNGTSNERPNENEAQLMNGKTRKKQALSVSKNKKVKKTKTTKIKKAAKYTKKQKNGEAESNDEFCEKSGTEDGEEAEPEQNTNTKRKGVNGTSNERPNENEAQLMNGKTRKKEALSVSKNKKVKKTTTKIKKAAKYNKKQKNDETGCYDEFCDEIEDEDEKEEPEESNMNQEHKGVNGTTDERPNGTETQAMKELLRNQLFLNEKHVNYFQIQGQLHVTQRKYCLYVTWTNEDIMVKRVERDDNFWKEEMEEKLSSFFNEALLPELAIPRLAGKKPA